ncbi:MAG: glycosyltransferase [Rhodospirillales bacterium]|nr:glycosyltransferase [Rhodospirillales bacterium]
MARGQRIFTLSYHTPSLEPGNTPYVRNQRDLANFLDALSGYLSFFRDTLGGSFATIGELHASLLAGQEPPPPLPPRELPRLAPGTRCLVVANTFPPVHGGSAVVYDSLARFGRGRVAVLAPEIDYRNDMFLRGWRECDRAAPFPVYRIARLRTSLGAGAPGIWPRLVTALQELHLRIAQLLALRRVVRRDGIGVICIGELIGSGWLTFWCRPFLRCASIVYVHGEEISTRTQYDRDGRRRGRWLGRADAIVAVSRFTRDHLVMAMHADPARIHLISNGVDLRRFTPRPRRAELIARYGLAGRRVLLTVGRLYQRKGMDKVIEALPEVLARLPDLTYLLVGEGALRPTLEASVRRLGLGDRVVFAGAVADDELVDHYALGDVFIMANREMPDGDNEGFGLVFLEANACGVPVIAGRAGGSVDAVQDGVNGLVVDGNDVAMISAAILRLFEDEALRLRLAAQGLAIASAAGWDRRVDEFLALCEAISPPRPSGQAAAAPPVPQPGGHSPPR